MDSTQRTLLSNNKMNDDNIKIDNNNNNENNINNETYDDIKMLIIKIDLIRMKIKKYLKIKRKKLILKKVLLVKELEN